MEDAREWLEALLLPERSNATRASWVARLIIWLGLFAWGAWFVFHGIDPAIANDSFLHMVNLPFHEAGHLGFMIFGRFMSILGGSLGQLLMPTICCLTLLLKTRDAFGASVAFWWIGQSHIDLAPYVDDARAQRLMLLGGVTGRESGMHDWNNILTDLNILMWDHTVARVVFGLGAASIAFALTWGAVALLREHRALLDEAA